MLVSFGAESVFDLLSVSSEQGRKQHFESGGGEHILVGGLGVLPLNILKDVDAISRILVHLPCF